MIDNEIEKLIHEHIEHDKSLTQQQRREERYTERLVRYEERLARMQALLKAKAPEPIMALAAMNLWNTAWAIWEDDMRHEFGQWMVERFRKESGRCNDCGDDLPLPYTDQKRCHVCVAESDNLEAELEDE